MSRAFTPVRIGSWELPQSFVMAPLTRNRAGAGNAPTELNATYYAQRAGAGLIVTEGTAPSAVGQGYLNVPGLYTDEQVEGWRLVADEVHDEGGHIVAQLMHAGRIAHADNKDGVETVSASAVQAPGEMVTAEGAKPHDEPARAWRPRSSPGWSQDYVTASRNAVEAGLDGVEIHAANGYLLHQFLDPTINLREDAYGGSPENRARFVVEVVTAVAEADRRREGRPADLARTPVQRCRRGGRSRTSRRRTPPSSTPWRRSGLAYLSILASPLEPLKDLVADLRRRFGGPVLLNDSRGSRPSSIRTVPRVPPGPHAQVFRNQIVGRTCTVAGGEDMFSTRIRTTRSSGPALAISTVTSAQRAVPSGPVEDPGVDQSYSGRAACGPAWPSPPAGVLGDQSAGTG